MTEQAPAMFDAEVLFTRWGAELRTALAQTLNGVYLRGSLARQVCTRPAGTTPPALPDGTQQVSFSPGRVTGWTFHLPEGAAGSAMVRLYDGTDTSGSLLAGLALVQGQHVSFEHHGIAFTRGLYVGITGAGADGVEGVVYLGATE